MFSDMGRAVLHEHDSTDELRVALIVLNSRIFSRITELCVAAGDRAARTYEGGILNRLPYPNISLTGEIREAINEVVNLCVTNTSMDETDCLFVIPPVLKKPSKRLKDSINSFRSYQVEMHALLKKRVRQFESYVCEKYGIGKAKADDIDEWFCRYAENDIAEMYSLVSYTVGIVYGR